MKRFTRAMGAVVLGALVAGSLGNAGAQDAPDVALRAQLASIALDATTLPDGYTLEGEAFLTADQVATGSLEASALTDAGFVVQYVSIYKNPSTSGQIRSYASAWSDADAATAGFGVIEDETVTSPDSELTDAETSVGEEPRETTSGSYPNPDLANATVNTVDVTFRADRFLVGVAVETTDNSEVDVATADALAAEAEGRATAVVGGDSAEGTNVALVPQVLPVPGTELQAGFLTAGEVEQLYGLQGSSLGSLTSSWSQVVGLGQAATPQPFVAVGLTTFKDDAAAKAVLDQVSDLSPDLAGAEVVDGVAVEGADGVVGIRFTSAATGAADPDSFRIFFIRGASLAVIDVQGASSAEVAQSSAVAFATAQAACVGQPSCAAPKVPEDLRPS